eukprot:PhM_4_TR5984/c0_g1_i1/m.99475
MAGSIALRRKAVVVAARRVLDRLERELRRGPADDDGEVVRRARGGADRGELLLEELAEGLGVEQALRLLVQERLVGAAAALGDKHKVVLVALVGVDVNLGREVRAGVLLLVHCKRCHLTVPQVGLRVRAVDTVGEVLLVVGVSPNVLPLVPADDGRARVLATGQDATRRNVRVLEELKSDEAVVVGRLGVIEDLAQLREMTRAEEMGNVVEGLAGNETEGLGCDRQNILPFNGLDVNVVARDETVRGVVVVPHGEHRAVLKGHGRDRLLRTVEPHEVSSARIEKCQSTHKYERENTIKYRNCNFFRE